tara:strand:+ start:464 stop:676 length:213 start_codon:yes stop_codon:yes gene_type:complete
MSDYPPVLKALKEAYATLDDARAKLEEVQSDMRQIDSKGMFYQAGEIDAWLGDLYLMSESLLDWTGRPDD